MQSKASLPVIRRLPKYYRYLSNMKNNGIKKVSSSELARTWEAVVPMMRASSLDETFLIPLFFMLER